MVVLDEHVPNAEVCKLCPMIGFHEKTARVAEDFRTELKKSTRLSSAYLSSVRKSSATRAVFSWKPIIGQSLQTSALGTCSSRTTIHLPPKGLCAGFITNCSIRKLSSVA